MTALVPAVLELLLLLFVLMGNKDCCFRFPINVGWCIKTFVMSKRDFLEIQYVPVQDFVPDRCDDSLNQPEQKFQDLYCNGHPTGDIVASPVQIQRVQATILDAESFNPWSANIVLAGT